MRVRRPAEASRWGRALLAVGLAALIAGCSSNDSDKTSAQAADSPSASPTVVAVDPAQVVPLADRVLARIQMPIDGDDLVEVGGSIWVKSEIGYVVRVDARTNRVLGRLRLDDKGLPSKRYCQGIGTDGTSVWTCSTHLKTTSIVRLDPRTGKVAETFGI